MNTGNPGNPGKDKAVSQRQSEPSIEWTGRRVLVVGLGRFGGGVGVSRWLSEQGAKVTVVDQSKRSTLTESMELLADIPVQYRFGKHRPEDLNDQDLVILNPAVQKKKSALFAEIVQRNLCWTTEINLFCERCLAKMVAVTGTYGKSTTCAMIAHTMETERLAGCSGYTDVHLGGNIGRSLLPELARMRSTDLVVLELSNAQLEDLHRIEWAPRVAVITNLYPHHLDRHGSFDEYIKAKLNIVGHPTRTEILFHGELADEALDSLTHLEKPAIDRIHRIGKWNSDQPLRAPGRHNQRNAATAQAVCGFLGVNAQRTREALATFAGLPHRLEFVAEYDGIGYYDDSKSTSPDATVVALSTLPRAAVVIVGGRHRDASLDAVARSLAKQCRVVICIGEAGRRFADAVCSARSSGNRCEIHNEHDLAAAVKLASGLATPGEIVLFSPGAPSFDAFANFAQRGLHFQELVTGGKPEQQAGYPQSTSTPRGAFADHRKTPPKTSFE